MTDSALQLLAEISSRPPVGVWSAPGRVNLIGEHTDYNDGLVFPFTTPHRTTVAVAPREDRRLRVISEIDPVPVEVALDDLTTMFPRTQHLPIPEWSAYPLGVAWALTDGGRNEQAAGYDLAFTSNVPLGAGLSSSAALENATAVALNDLWALGRDRRDLARVGQRAENDAVGAPTGIMDQLASLFGESDRGVFIDCRSLQTRTVPLGFADADLDVVVIDTHVRHAHSTGGYRERRESCERAARELGVASLRDVGIADLDRAARILDDVTFRRMRHVVTENQRVLDVVGLCEKGEPTAVGPILTASHASMRDDFEISVPELDVAVESSVAAGALGARMTGGGFGGAVIALTPHSRVAALAAGVTAAFADRAFTPPACFAISASAGAGRDL